MALFWKARAASRSAGAGLLQLLREAPEGSLIRSVTPADLYRLIAG